MTLAQLSPAPVFKAFANDGTPLAYGLLYSYQAGTTTPQATYPSQSESTPNTNPIQLNARGECALWLDPTLSYKLNLTDQYGNQISGYPVDNISGGSLINGNLIPATSNTYTLGTSSDSWANAYFGPAFAPIYNAVTGNLGYYGITSAESSAGVTPTNYAYQPGDVRRYGTITGSGGADTSIVQAAINQSMKTGGSPWVVPYGVTVSVQTSGSTSTPVGDALTITSSCVGVINGTILGNNNCNIINCSGSNVTITGSGLIKGYGTYFATGSLNGACFKNTGSHCTFAVDVASPPQYGVYYESSTSVGGFIGPLSITGGIGSYVNNQNYGIEIEGPWNGLIIDDISVYPDGTGGVVVQGVAGGYDGGNATSVTVSNINVNGCWDHGMYFFCTNSSISNVTGTNCGAGLRVVGIDNTLSNFNSFDSTGGIDLEDSAGTTLTGFQISGCHGIALSVELLDTVVDGQMSQQSITNGVISFNSSDTTTRCGVRVLCDFGGTNTNQWDLILSNIQVINATQSATQEGAIRLEVPSGKTLSRVRVQNCIVDTCGYVGIEVAGGGTLLDSHIDNNTIRNPGSASGASGSSTSAINVNSGSTMQYGSVNFNDAIDDRGGSAKMATAYTVSGTQTFVAFNGNSARGYTSAFGTFLQASDYTAGSTTPSVQNRNSLDISNSVSTTITNFLNAQEGQVLALTFEDGNTTITRANAVLSGGTNFTSAQYNTLTLIKRGSTWYELCRSSNS